MKEIEKNIRELVIETLKFLSLKEVQLNYQENVPIADVSAELFCQWEGAYIPGSKYNDNAFSRDEIIELDNFNKIIEKIAENTPDQLPHIEEFVRSEAWKDLSDAARATLGKMRCGEGK